MSIKPCKECGANFDPVFAKKCPNCGTFRQKRIEGMPITLVLLGIVIVFFIVISGDNIPKEENAAKLNITNDIDRPSGQVPINNTAKSNFTVQGDSSNSDTSSDQVREIAREFGVSKAKIHDSASHAAELSGGKATKQDMLDAMESATGGNGQSSSSTRNDQAREIAREFGVSEARVHGAAGLASTLSGGRATEKDMLDAMKAAIGD